MRILVLGAGKMGTWITDCLCFDHEVAIYDPDHKKLRFVFNTIRMTDPKEIESFKPELVINAVTLKYTIDAFETVLPYLPTDCILSDIASVKNGLKDYYKEKGFRFVSTHPMFGPTFANIQELSTQNAVIISESDHMGKAFFKDFYGGLRLKLYEYSFKEHDEITAYSLSIPFSSTLVFAACMKNIEAPGTTFKKHMAIAQGLLSEDDYLLSEILFNEFTYEQVEKIRKELRYLLDIIKDKDSEKMKAFLTKVRENINHKKPSVS